jgi:hypothetical protein
MPGHSASKTRVNALMLPGIDVFLLRKQDVDGRKSPSRVPNYTPILKGIGGERYSR